jgi:hypothetical protein
MENDTVTAEVANTIEAAPPPPPATPATPELSERIASLEASLAQRDTELATVTQAHETLKKDFVTVDTAHKEAVTEYRKLAVISNPIFNPEMLAGNSIPEISAAMTRITDLAAKVRSKIEADIKSISVPAGAPERSGPDTSGLSARDKISYAIQNDKK